jgi:hypothetical protein
MTKKMILIYPYLRDFPIGIYTVELDEELPCCYIISYGLRYIHNYDRFVEPSSLLLELL